MTPLLIGIDEVGRGPLAGPVMVGVVVVPLDFAWTLLPGVTDSKLLTAPKREALFHTTVALRRKGVIDFAIGQTSAARIDKIGIVPAIDQALRRALVVLERRQQYQPSVVMVKLDGGLKAPSVYRAQETIIKGDQKEKVIGLASVLAKVTRDRYMEKHATLPALAPYDFARHKGYGTPAHRAAIAKYGLSGEHRASFCRSCWS